MEKCVIGVFGWLHPLYGIYYLVWCIKFDLIDVLDFFHRIYWNIMHYVSGRVSVRLHAYFSPNNYQYMMIV